MGENLKLTLTQGTTYEVGTFTGEAESWTIQASEVNTSSTNPYNIAISQNTMANNSSTGEWYYPWYAATAGQGTNATNPTITRSICPKGWRLPPWDTDNVKSFYNLIYANYNITFGEYNATSNLTILQSFPMSFTLNGDIYGGSLGWVGHGNHWSASPNTSNSTRAYDLHLGPNGVYRQNCEKFYGLFVRCVAV